MNEPGETTVRRLTAEDANAVTAFECRTFAQPWTDTVQAMIRDRLLPELELTDDLEAWGLWVGDDLAAMVAWKVIPESQICDSIVLAVDSRYRRRGYGRRLKQFELDQAREAGARSVVSIVEWENDPMIELNWSLGGTFSRFPEDPKHLRCVIPL